MTDDHSSESQGEQPGFRFFPPRDSDPLFEGREPHEAVKSDPLADQFPTERQIAFFLFLASLGLYLASMSWSAFPGLPTWILMNHLRMEVAPPALDPLWGILVRRSVHLPWLRVAGWMGLFSAICGAASVALTGRLMVRVGYLIRNEPGAESFAREARARRLSGLVAGFYLACSIPVWVASTRSLPDSFHLLLLVVTAYVFSEYQHWGRLWRLGLLTFIYGVGLAESATFLVFLPVAVFLVAREMFRWRSLWAWRSQVVAWGGLFAGLALYGLAAYLLFRRGVVAGLYDSRFEAFSQIIREQVQHIIQIRFSPGFPVVIFVTLMPWLTLFAMSRRSPWFYEWGQVLVRLIFVGGLFGVLYNATYSPWHLLGMGYLAVTPYLLLAACMGYMAGEFWILGEVQVLADHYLATRIARRVSSVFAWVLPVAVLASSVFNWRTVDGRYGKIVEDSVLEILDRLDGRDIVFSSGLLDDPLRMAAWELRAPVRIISASRTGSPIYLKKVAQMFIESDLKMPLMQGDFGKFIDVLLMSESGPGRVAIIDMPDVFREFGYLVPDGFLYRLEASADRVDPAAQVEMQRAFWARMVRMAEAPAPEENLARPFQDQLLLQASKVANNLGVLLAERGDVAGALEVFRAARRMYPENVSVLLNLIEAGRERELPDMAEWEAAWDEVVESARGGRWVLAVRYGNVWKARNWVKRGHVWALSGVPTMAEGARRNPVPAEEDETALMNWLDQAYLQWGREVRDELHYRGILMRNEKDTTALMILCQLALRRNDPEAAEAYVAEALAMGLPEEEVWFDRAMIDYVRGEEGKSRTAIEELARLTPGDARVWMALIMLTEAEDPLNEQAIKTLKSHRAAGLGVRLALASVFMLREEWDRALAELEQAVLIDSKNLQVWEMMASLGNQSGRPALMQASLRALQARDPNHFLRFQSRGVELYQSGKIAEAEAEFRQGIRRKRDSRLLNNLAHILMEQDRNLQEALELVNEAIRREGTQAIYLSTRAEIYLKLGRYDEARNDLQEGLKRRGRNPGLLLLLAQCYEGLGDRERALKVAAALAQKPDELSENQKLQLKLLSIRLR